MVDHEGTSFIDGKILSQNLGSISYVEQKADIDYNFPVKVKECVSLGLFSKVKPFSNLKKQDWQYVQEALSQVDLADYANRQISQLSGGQFQRMLLARCLVQDADYIFLDEPFVGIDIISEELIVGLLQKLKKEGKTILIITHDYEFAAMTCNRVLHFVDEGHVETFSLQENLPRLYSCLMCQ